MRLYNLKNKSNIELTKLLNMVKTHSDLTIEEKIRNIENIEAKLKGTVNGKRIDILKDIEAGSADLPHLD